MVLRKSRRLSAPRSRSNMERSPEPRPLKWAFVVVRAQNNNQPWYNEKEITTTSAKIANISALFRMNRRNSGTIVSVVAPESDELNFICITNEMVNIKTHGSKATKNG